MLLAGFRSTLAPLGRFATLGCFATGSASLAALLAAVAALFCPPRLAGTLCSLSSAAFDVSLLAGLEFGEINETNSGLLQSSHLQSMEQIAQLDASENWTCKDLRKVRVGLAIVGDVGAGLAIVVLADGLAIGVVVEHTPSPISTTAINCLILFEAKIVRLWARALRWEHAVVILSVHMSTQSALFLSSWRLDLIDQFSSNCNQTIFKSVFNGNDRVANFNSIISNGK